MGYCKDCVYFVKDAYESDFGFLYNECHRFPKSVKNGWPIVNENDWCGEFAPGMGVSHLRPEFQVKQRPLKPANLTTKPNPPPTDPKKPTKFLKY